MADKYTMGQLLHLTLYRMDQDGTDYEVRVAGYDRFEKVIEHTAEALCVEHWENGDKIMRMIKLDGVSHADVKVVNG